LNGNRKKKIDSELSKEIEVKNQVAAKDKKKIFTSFSTVDDSEICIDHKRETAVSALIGNIKHGRWCT
jgi:hypothetical protein